MWTAWGLIHQSQKLDPRFLIIQPRIQPWMKLTHHKVHMSHLLVASSWGAFRLFPSPEICSILGEMLMPRQIDSWVKRFQWIWNGWLLFSQSINWEDHVIIILLESFGWSCSSPLILLKALCSLQAMSWFLSDNQSWSKVWPRVSSSSMLSCVPRFEVPKCAG